MENQKKHMSTLHRELNSSWKLSQFLWNNRDFKCMCTHWTTKARLTTRNQRVKREEYNRTFERECTERYLISNYVERTTKTIASCVYTSFQLHTHRLSCEWSDSQTDWPCQEFFVIPAGSCGVISHFSLYVLVIFQLRTQQIFIIEGCQLFQPCDSDRTPRVQ